MDEAKSIQCTTCYGTGEAVSEAGPEVCPDCFGDGKPLGGGNKLEWRLRAIVRAHQGSPSEAAILWLVHELRRNREALVGILTRSQDADPSDAFAAEIRHRANEALGLYEEEPAS